LKFTINIKKETLSYFKSLISSEGINLVLARKDKVLFLSEDKNGIIKIVNFHTSCDEEFNFKISALTLESLAMIGYLTFKNDESSNELCIGYTSDEKSSKVEKFRQVVREPLEIMSYDAYSVYLNIFTSNETITDSENFSQYFNIMLKMCAINEEGIQFKNNLIYNISNNKYIYVDVPNMNANFAVTNSHLKELIKIKDTQTFTKFNNYLIAKTKGIYTLAISTAYIKEDFYIPEVFNNDSMASLHYTANLITVNEFLRSMSKTTINKLTTVKSYIDIKKSTLNLILGQINFIFKLQDGNLDFNKIDLDILNIKLFDLIDLCKFLNGCKMDNAIIHFFVYKKNLRLNINGINILLRLEDIK